MTKLFDVEERRRLIAADIVNSQDVGATLRRYRLSCGLSQVRMASLLGISQGNLCDYEHALRPNPTLNRVRKFVEVFADQIEPACEVPV